MNCSDILNFWKNAVPEGWEKTCDGFRYPTDRTVDKIAVCFKLTLDSLSEIAAWGALLVIVHEPLYHRYDTEMPADETDPTVRKMHEILTENRITVLRLHDHAHLFPDDFIHMGFLETMGLPIAKKDAPMRLGFCEYTLAKPMTTREIAVLTQKKLDCPHPRMSGSVDTSLTKIVLALGGIGPLAYSVLSQTDAELLITGECDEFSCAYYTHAAKYLGINRSLIVLGHCESERFGMKALGEWTAQHFPNIEFRYFPTEDTYEIL